MKYFREYLLLLVLYTLQGIPMGLSGTIPFLLESKINFTQQAALAVVSWPFSLKLLWAPIVDGWFIDKVGRRRTWVIPTQILCGILMVLVTFSDILPTWMGDIEGIPVNVTMLTVYFLVLYFLMATQDIAVDGWALTLLPPSLQHQAGQINAGGQTLGYFLSYVVFLVLNNGEYCDRARLLMGGTPTGDGFLSLVDFFRISGLAFIVTTVYVWAFVEEGVPARDVDEEGREIQADNEEEDQVLSVKDTFKQFVGLVSRVKPLQIFTAIIFGQGACLAVQSSALQLKVVHAGLPATKLAVLSPIFIGIGILLPVVMAKFIRKDNTLKWMWRSMIMQVVLVPLAFYLPSLVANDVQSSLAANPSLSHGDISVSVLFLVIATVLLATVQSNMYFCAQLSFFPSVADPRIGGTYITMLTTLSNASKSFIRPLSMVFIQHLDDNADVLLPKGWSGYELAVLLLGGFGSLWWLVACKKPMWELQALEPAEWWVRVSSGKSATKVKTEEGDVKKEIEEEENKGLIDGEDARKRKRSSSVKARK